nr:unnamed protein product [Callosobruchus analis]
MFPALKKHLGGKKFDSDAEVQKEVNTWLREADGEWYSAGIDKFIVRMCKAATTKNENANLNLDRVFRTPKDYSKVDFDHFEIVERNNFREDDATLPTPSKEAAKDCTDDRTEQRAKCIANANAKINVRFGGGDKQYFYGPPQPPRALPGILPLPTITAIHEGDHITRKRKTTLSDSNTELNSTPELANFKDSSSSNNVKVLHIGDKATTIPNAILFTSSCNGGEADPTGIPDVIVHTVYPSKDDESVTEPTKHSAVQIAPDDTFFKGHPKIVKAWMLKKKGVTSEQIEEVTNATDTIYNEALRKIGAILLHFQAGGEKECRKDDLDRWLNASLVPYRCKACDCERTLLVSYPIDGESKDVECVCSEDSSTCSCKPCSCGECCRDPSVPFGKRFRADEDMLHKMSKHVNLRQLPSTDTMNHPKAKPVLHSKGMESDLATAVEQDLDKVQNEIVGEVLTRRYAKRMTEDGNAPNRNGVNAVDGQTSQELEQLDRRVVKRETAIKADVNQKRGETDVAKFAATEPTPRNFVPGSDQINQSDAPQLDRHLAKREDIPLEEADQKRDEVEVAKLAATEPTPRKFVPGSDQINQSDAPQLDKHLAKREDIPLEEADQKRGEVEVAKLAATEPTPRKFVPGSDQINQSDAPQLDKHLAKREDIPLVEADLKRDEVEVAKLASTEPTPRRLVPGSDQINQSDAPQLDKHLAKREDIPLEEADQKRDEVEVAKLAATEPTPGKFVPGSDQINQSDAPQLDKHLAKREDIPLVEADQKRGEVEVAKLAATEPTPRKFVPGSDQINQSDAPQLDKHLAKREDIPLEEAEQKRDEVEVAKLAATEPTPRKFVPGSDQINQSDAPQLDRHLAKREDIPLVEADLKRDEVEVAKLASTEPTPRRFVPGSDQLNQSDAPQLDKHLAKCEDIPLEEADQKRDEVEVAKLASTEPTPGKFVPGMDKHLAKREDIPLEEADQKRDEVEAAKLAATEPTPRKFVPGSDQINQSDAPQLDKHLAKREDVRLEETDQKRDEVEVAKLAATEPTPRKFVPGSDQINQSDAPQLDKHLAKREDVPLEEADQKRDGVEVAKLAATEPTPRKFVPELDKHLAKREFIPLEETDQKRDEVEVAKLAATEPTPRKFVPGSDQINQSDAPQLDKHLAKREDVPLEEADQKRDEVEVAKLAATEPTPRKFVPGSDQINQSDAPQLDKHLAKREDIPLDEADQKRDEVEVAKLAATEPTPRKFVPGSDQINQSDAPQLDKHLAKREDIPLEEADQKRDEVEVAKLAATEPTPRKFVPGSDQINQSDAPQLDKHLAKREDIPLEEADQKRDEVEVAKLAATEPTPRKFVPGSDQINQSDAPQLDKHLAKREDIPLEEADQKRDEVEVAKLAATEPTPRKFVPGSDQINQSDAPQLDKHLAKREDIPLEETDQKRDEVEVAKLAATEPTPRKFVPGSDQINQSDAPQLDKHLAKREDIPLEEADQKRDEVEVAKLAATEPTPRKFVPGSDQINQSDAPQLDKHLAKREDIPLEEADQKRDEVEVAKLAATEPTPRKFVPGSDQINQSDAPQLDKHLAKREDIPLEEADQKRDEVEVAKLAATEPTPRKFVPGSDQINQSDAPQLDKHLAKREDIPLEEADQKRDEVEVAKLAATEPTPRKFVPGSDQINQSDAPQLDKHLAKREDIPLEEADQKRDEVEVAKLAATEPTPRKFVPGSDQINQSDAPQLDKHLAKREDIPLEEADQKRDEVEVAKLAATEPTPRKFVPGSDQINQSDAPQLDKHLAKREDIPLDEADQKRDEVEVAKLAATEPTPRKFVPEADQKRDEVEVAKLAATEPTPRKFVPGSDQINQSDAPQLDKHLAKREDIPLEEADQKRDEVEVAKLAATEPTPRKFVPGSDQINQSDAPQLDKHLAKREDIPLEEADQKRDEVEVAKLAATEPTPRKFVPEADQKRDEVEVAKLAATEPTPRKFVPGSDQINHSDAPQLDKHLAKREDMPLEEADQKRDEVEVAKLAATEPTPRKFVPGSDQINQSDAPQLDKHLAKRETYLLKKLTRKGRSRDAPQLDKHLAKREDIPLEEADQKRDEVEVAKLAATEPTPRKFVPGSDQINQSDAPQLDKHLAKREDIPLEEADQKRDEVEVAKLAATEPTPRKFVPGSDQINQSDAPQLDKHLAKREDIPLEEADQKRDEVEVAKLAATEPTPRKFVPCSDQINQSDAPQLNKHLAKREDIPLEEADQKRDEVEVAKLAAKEPTPRKFVPGSDQINQSDAPQLDKHLAKREDIPLEEADQKRYEVEVAKLAATEPTPRKFVPGSDQINQSDAPQLEKHLAKREDIPLEEADQKRGEGEVAKLAATEPTPRKFVPGSDQINQSDAPQLDKHLAKREFIPLEETDQKRDEVEVAKLAATEPTPRKFVPGSDQINQSDAPQLDKHLAKREDIPLEEADQKRGEGEVAKLAATEPTPRKFVPGSDQINQSDAPQLDKHLAKREDIPLEEADQKRDEVEVAKLAATEPTPRKFVPGSDQINQSDAPQLDKHLAKREFIPLEETDQKRDEVEVAKLAATEPTPRKFVPGSDQINQSDAPQLDKHLAKREFIPLEETDQKRDEVEVAKLAATEPTPRKFVPGSDQINQSDAPQLDKHLAKREDIPLEEADQKRGEGEVAKLAATEPTPRKFVPGSDQINQSDAPQLDKHLAKREDIPLEEADQKRDEVEVAKLAATEPTPRKFVPGSDQINQSDAPQLDKHLAKREDIPLEEADQKRYEVEVAKLAATEPTPRKFVPGSDQINQSDAPQLDKHLAKREDIPLEEADQKRGEGEVAKLAATEPTPRKFVPGSDQINQSDAPQLDKHLAKREFIPLEETDQKRDEVEVAKLAATEPTPRKFVPGSDQINQSDAPQLDKHLAKREDIPLEEADQKRGEGEVAKLAATELTPRKFVPGSDQINQSDAPQLDKHLAKREDIPLEEADQKRDEVEVAKLAATEPTPRKFVPGSDQINQSDAPQLDKHVARREDIPLEEAQKRGELEVAKLAATVPAHRKAVTESDRVESLSNTAILCPKNADVDKMNDQILGLWDGDYTTYLSDD